MYAFLKNVGTRWRCEIPHRIGDFRSIVEARRPLDRPSVLSTPDNYANDARERQLMSRWRISIVVELVPLDLRLKTRKGYSIHPKKRLISKAPRFRDTKQSRWRCSRSRNTLLLTDRSPLRITTIIRAVIKCTYYSRLIGDSNFWSTRRKLANGDILESGGIWKKRNFLYYSIEEVWRLRSILEDFKARFEEYLYFNAFNDNCLYDLNWS